ncbi:hypothetical protein ACB092_11G158400 [Castanea dentata]
MVDPVKEQTQTPLPDIVGSGIPKLQHSGTKLKEQKRLLFCKMHFLLPIVRMKILIAMGMMWERSLLICIKNCKSCGQMQLRLRP